MQEIGRSNGTFLNRIYYEDDNGDIVTKILEQDITPLIDYNKAMADAFREHRGDNVRVTAEIPMSLYYKWMVEEQVPVMGSQEMHDVVTKKLQDPAYKYLCTVPENYQHMTR